MKNIKTFLALSIILGAILIPSTAFAQDNSDKKEIQQMIKDKRAALKDEIKDKRDALKSDIKDLRDARPAVDSVVPSLNFTGVTSGWAYISGAAHQVKVELTGDAGKINQNSWKINGTATMEIGDRTITFDIAGHARGKNILLKGTTEQFEGVVIHLNGIYAPVSGEPGSFAMSFNRSGITSENTDVRIPLVLVGQVDVTSLDGSEIPQAESDLAVFS